MDPSVTNTIIFLNVGSIEADREIVISGHFYKDKKRLKCKLNATKNWNLLYRLGKCIAIIINEINCLKQ